MGLRTTIEKQVGVPILVLFAGEVVNALDRNTPSVTGNLRNSMPMTRTGNMEFTLYGPAYARIVENGTPEPETSTWTRTHRQRYKGTLRWVTRTYTNYQRPKRIPALEGRSDGPWRVVQDYARMGHYFIRRSITEALESCFGRRKLAASVIPETIEIVSSD